jgi:hypothetical protein
MMFFLQDIKKLFKQEGGFIKTRWAMHEKRNIVGATTIANGNATMRYACIVELHVTVNNTTILCVAQKCFCGEFLSQVTIKNV